MKEKRFMKKLAACFLFGLLLAVMAVPVSAAAYSKKGGKDRKQGAELPYHEQQHQQEQSKEVYRDDYGKQRKQI